MATEKSGLHPETLVAQGLGRVAQPYGDIVAPIHVATTYERGADGAYPGGRVYSRADNPTYDQVEALIASLEGAAGAMVFASGQAASGAVFLSLLPGEGVLAPRNMYWALRKWLTGFLAPRGHPVAFYDNAVPDDLARQARAVRPRLANRSLRNFTSRPCPKKIYRTNAVRSSSPRIAPGPEAGAAGAASRRTSAGASLGIGAGTGHRDCR